MHLLRQVCHSLSEAESCGLVHRDIKPANIFVCRYGEDCDFVKVLDFGIAKAAGVGGNTEPALTQQHVIHGTPAFIAPEQALGRSDLDGRVDIYATGCVAYWLLTGQLVFNADTPMALLMHHATRRRRRRRQGRSYPIPTALDNSCCRAWQKTLPSGRSQQRNFRAVSDVRPGCGRSFPGHVMHFDHPVAVRLRAHQLEVTLVGYLREPGTPGDTTG